MLRINPEGRTVCLPIGALLAAVLLLGGGCSALLDTDALQSGTLDRTRPLELGVDLLVDQRKLEPDRSPDKPVVTPDRPVVEPDRPPVVADQPPLIADKPPAIADQTPVATDLPAASDQAAATDRPVAN